MGRERLETTLVTGGTGFVGRHLVDRLRRDGCRVRVLVEPTVTPELPAEIELVRGDLRDRSTVERAVAGCTRVFHLGARTGDGRSTSRELFETNVEGTANVAEAALESNVTRLVFCSATAVYGLTDNHHIDEQSPLLARSLYGRSKLAAERRLLESWQRSELPVVIARVAETFGAGAVEWFPLLRAISEGHFRLIGPGSARRHPIAIDDLVDGLVLCGTVEGIEGRTYLLSGAEPLSIRAMLDLIAAELGCTIEPSRLPVGALHAYRQLDRLTRAVGVAQLPRFDRVELFLNNREFDLTKAGTELGYRPRSSIEDAIAATACSFRETQG